MSFLSLLQKRRTQYALNKDLPMPLEQTEQLIKEVVRESPSAFNSQSSRVVILHNDEHIKFWTIVKDILREIVPAENFAPTDEKINGFMAGAGTVLFFEDQDVIKGLQEQFPIYADKFPVFAANSAGMAQLAVWTALAEKDIGASLQHYNPIIDEAVRKAWNLPASWELSAQMPFGGHAAEIGTKEYMDDADRFKSFGA